LLTEREETVNMRSRVLLSLPLALQSLASIQGCILSPFDHYIRNVLFDGRYLSNLTRKIDRKRKETDEDHRHDSVWLESGQRSRSPPHLLCLLNFRQKEGKDSFFLNNRRSRTST